MISRSALGLSVILLICSSAFASGERITERHFQRIKQAKSILDQLEPRSIGQIADELNQTDHPQSHLQIYEAVAATYMELVDQQDIRDEEQRKELYNQIRLNVAFIQFGGDFGSSSGTKLDRWIRRRLKNHLPREILKNEKMFFSADDWNKK